jgi:hypothetical protein
MKNNKIIRSLAAFSLVLSLFAVGSRAASYYLTPGSFTVLVSRFAGAQNPNGFPVVIVYSTTPGFLSSGFLLDGSEFASDWLKTLKDACVNNRAIGINTDDNWAHAYDGILSENGYTGGAYKIQAITTYP